MSKNAWLAALICANVLLLMGICLVSYSLPAAKAQGTGLAQHILAVSGEIQDKYDALYILDTRERTLHTFVWDKGRRELQYTDWRDIERDFRNNRN